MLSPIFPQIYRVSLSWSNAWLLADGADVVLIDSGTSRDRPALARALRRYAFRALRGGLADLRLHGVLLTHGHCDHAGNAAWLARRFGAKVHAHQAEAPFLQTPRTYGHEGRLSRVLFEAGEVVWPVERCRLDVTLRGDERIDTPIGALRVVATPGHSPGHLSYWHEPSRRLFSGDAVINVIPWVRRTGLSLPVGVFTADKAQMRQSARRVAELEASALLSGHGRAHTQNTAAALRDFAAGMGSRE